jgi:hypothetical protein
VLVAAHELMQGERDFVWMRCAPHNDAFELDDIVGYRADFHQFSFDCLRISHRTNLASMHVDGGT